MNDVYILYFSLLIFIRLSKQESMVNFSCSFLFPYFPQSKIVLESNIITVDCQYSHFGGESRG